MLLIHWDIIFIASNYYIIQERDKKTIRQMGKWMVYWMVI